MKRIISVMAILAILFSVLGACKEKNEPETTTVPTSTTAESITEYTTAETTQEEITTEYVTTSKLETSTAKAKTETIRVKNEEHSFTFEKTDFEKNYSEELLMEILKLIPMEYGCDDYKNWNGTPNEILNDAYFGTSVWQCEGFEYNSLEWNNGVKEMKKNPYGIGWGEYSFTDIEKINSYLKDIYGPNARTFKVDDFERFDDVMTSEKSIFENYDYNFRYVYLPETDLVVKFTNEFYCGGEACYVCDIKTEGDLYIVKAVTGSEDIRENENTFEGIQKDALKMFNTYTYGKLSEYVFTIGNDEECGLYMKSVDKSYIFPDNMKMNYRVTADNVKVEAKNYISGEWEVIDTLSEGDEFYSSGYYYEMGYVRIDTEKYSGRVEKKYVTEIE